MNLLALDTSTDACSVALYCNDDVLVDHRIVPRKHAQLLLPAIEKMLAVAELKPSSLNGIAFGCGPGSFTGVRIAAACAQGLAFGADIGVIPVSSLQALAQGGQRQHKVSHVLATIDARMGEVYWSGYACDSAGVMQPVLEECVCAPEAVPLPANDSNDTTWCLLGSGIDEYEQLLSERCKAKLAISTINDCVPQAQDILSIALPIAHAGNFKPAEDAIPVYLRNRVALTEAERAEGQRL